MGVSKVVIIDPNTQTPDVIMDVTGDDTSAGVLLAGNVGTRNDGEKVTGTIPEKSSSDLTASGATVTAPAGHYATAASKSVASGTAGTPTATKGSVSNHSVNVTPSVTNTSGYISGGTKTGTPVSVSASELVSGTKSITDNGTGIDVTNYAAVDVAVPPTPLQTKSATPSESAQTVTPDSGYALSEVDISAIPSDYVGTGVPRRTASDLTKSGAIVFAPAGYYAETAGKSVDYGAQGTPTISVDSDGLITASATDTPGYITGTTKTATEQLSTQAAATITPSETVQTAVAAGKYTTGAVTVDAIPSDYVGSAIDQRDSSDLTASGATVTAPAGYYEEAASKAVASGSAKPPSSISGTSATVTAGTNTLTLSKTVSVTPSVTAGYISAGTAGNSSVSLTASVTTKAAATITPGTSNQTIAAGTYLTGAQTIAGSANLVAGNIKSGVNIFGKVGTFAGDATVYKDAWTSRGGTPEKSTASLSMSEWRQRGAATSVGDYALFAGGSPANSTSGSYTVDVISKNLTHSTLGSNCLVSASVGLAGTTVGNYALFGGGIATSVTAYSNTLTRTTATALSSYREDLAATTVGSYALFGGGCYNYYQTIYSTVEAYNTSLTKSTPTALSQGRWRLSATHIGSYALFAGGLSSMNVSSAVNTVNAYNTSLTRSTPTGLSEAKNLAGATNVGSYALFGGGGGSNGTVRTTVDAYNASLTRSIPTALSVARSQLAATSVGGYALFGGGYSLSAVVDAYNTSLTRSTPSAFSTARYYHSATTVADYAIFGLGYTSSQDSLGVEIYDIPYILTTTVPANYTYMFSDDATPVTVSTATSITKSSPVPINGIVCKAAATKTGQVT